MSHIKAAHVLPQELLTKIQEYVDGEFIYIPRIPANKRDWGEKTTTRRELQERNARIYTDYLSGERMETLAENYYLSLKSIQRIIGQMKKEHKS